MKSTGTRDRGMDGKGVEAFEKGNDGMPMEECACMRIQDTGLSELRLRRSTHIPHR